MHWERGSKTRVVSEITSRSNRLFWPTESQGGSDPSNMNTHAKKDGGDWIINGSKMWITNGSIADVAIIWAHR